MVVSGTVQHSGQFNAVRGMERAADKMAQAADHIAQASAEPSSVGGSESSSLGAGPAAVKDIGRAMVDLSMGDHSYRANLRSARASDAQFQQLVDMAIPQGYSRLVGDSAA